MAIFFGGFCLIGGQNAANALSATFYPTMARSTGVGWALGIGRLGGIAGPAIGGSLLAFGLPPKQIFLCACGPALIAATCTLMLTMKAARNREVVAATPQARTA